MVDGKSVRNTEQVSISRSERHGLMVAWIFGTALVIVIGLLGSDVFVRQNFAQDLLPWLINSDAYFRKDITIPLGAVTVVFILILQLDRKPRLELSMGTIQVVVSVVIAMVASGIINLTFKELWISAAIILSPAIAYWIVERISRCFVAPSQPNEPNEA